MYVNPLDKSVDAIFCINLNERPERKKWAANVFKLIGLESKVKFHVVNRHPQGGRYGCFESHIQVIKYCYKKGYNRILVFEDDMVPSPSYSKKLVQKTCDLMTKHDGKWDIFYLGYFPLSDQKKLDIHKFFGAPYIDTNLVLYNPLGTHAYCISRRGMKNILNRYKPFLGKVHYDIFLATQNLVRYCVTPLLFEQKFCFPTDNSVHNIIEGIARTQQCHVEKTHLLHFCSYWKQKTHELFSSTRKVEMVVFVILLLTIVLISISVILCLNPKL